MMDDRPRQILRDLVRRFGISLATDPLRIEGLLRDSCRTYNREIFVLVNAARQKVPADLLAPRHSLPLRLLQDFLARRLRDELSLSDEASQWAVESWAYALDLVPGVPEQEPGGEQMQQKIPESSAVPADPVVIARRQGWADDLESPNLETRLCAVQDLSHNQDPENIRQLVGALENGNWRVREGAFDALFSFGKQSVPLLCEALGHRNDEIVWRASLILGALKARSAIGPLILLLGREGMIRECAIWSLGEIGDDGASTALLRFIRSDDPMIKRETETALGKIGNAGKENCS
jgi:hypothetical protein